MVIRKLVAFNLAPVAILAAAAHAGHADFLIADPLLGSWIGAITAAFLCAVAALAVGRHDLSAWIGSRLTLLGMAGTLHGFILAFAAVGTATDLASTKTAIETLTGGISVAIYTTVAGLVFKLWLDVLTRWCR